MLRAVFHDEDDARTVMARLARDGFETHLARERFAGEDDDEDHPWAVTTDAPEFVMELLVDELDGWLHRGEATPEGTGTSSTRGLPAREEPAPLDLPDGPRRVQGHIRRPDGDR
ncbi:MAG: hypothetical protein ACXVYW_16255 [Oryzihumus sp.]